MITTNRERKNNNEDKRKQLSFVCVPHRRQKKEPGESVEKRLTSALKVLSNSHSAGNFKSCSESRKHCSGHSSGTAYY